jgi:hypothetical protein
MKKIACLLVAGFVLMASSKAQEKMSWKEMSDFHTVMSETFHPAEEGKMGPIKSRSQEMLDKAIAWKNSAIPEGYDKKTVKKSLKKLVDGSKELHKLIKANAADNVIKEKLSGLHDIFHQVMEKGEKEEHNM